MAKGTTRRDAIKTGLKAGGAAAVAVVIGDKARGAYEDKKKKR